MAEPHVVLNALSEDAASEALTRCCGAARWVEGMLARRPFVSTAALYAAAEVVWAALGPDDIREAFSHHPPIGADLDQLRAKFAATSGWSSQEQAGARQADEATLLALRDGNLAYRARFGYLFITCATGRSARAMLAELEARLQNVPEIELAVAAAEQAKITRLRLAKLGTRSPLTCHVLDTARGCPASGLEVRLAQWHDGSWTALAHGATDQDGRISDLLPPGTLAARRYRLTFETGPYFASQQLPVFYPLVEVTFDVLAPEEHHHIPLLLSPFGYSTYRGS